MYPSIVLLYVVLSYIYLLIYHSIDLSIYHSVVLSINHFLYIILSIYLSFSCLFQSVILSFILLVGISFHPSVNILLSMPVIIFFYTVCLCVSVCLISPSNPSIFFPSFLQEQPLTFGQWASSAESRKQTVGEWRVSVPKGE